MSHPLHVFQASPGVSPSAKITSFAVLSDGCQIAVGFSTGTLLLFSGQYIKEGSSGTGSSAVVSGNASSGGDSSGKHHHRGKGIVGSTSASQRFYMPDSVLLQRERQDKSYFPISNLHFCELRNSGSTMK